MWQWLLRHAPTLIAQARASHESGKKRIRIAAAPDHEAALLERAVRRVKANQLSRARRDLTSDGLAPGTRETLEALRDPARRPPQPTEPLDPEVLDYTPPAPVVVDPQVFAQMLRQAPRGSSGALSGTRFEYLKLALDDSLSLIHI